MLITEITFLEIMKKLIKILMTLCIHSNTQDIIKHGVIFKHENSLLTSNNAWKKNK